MLKLNYFRRLGLLTVIVLLGLNFIAQSNVPQKINYQAVAQNGPNGVLANELIDIEIQLISGSPNGTTVYSEQHSVYTNDYGLFYFEIGTGTQLQGNMQAIDWSSNNFYLKTFINGEDHGASSFNSVPYSLASKSTDQIRNINVSSGVPNNGDVLFYDATSNSWEPGGIGSVNGDDWGSQTVITDGTLSGDGTSSSPLSGFDGDYSNLTNQPVIPTQTSDLTNDVGFITTEIDGSITNEIQNLSISGNAVQISGGGVGFNLSGTTPVTNDVLQWNGTSWISGSVSGDNWGSQIVITDATLSGDGTSSSPLSGFDGDYLSLTNTPIIPTQTSDLTNDAGFITTEIDGSVTNEIQNLSISGNAVQISGGGTGFNLSSAVPAINEVLTWSGSTWQSQSFSNIYESDGVISSDRVVTIGSNTLNFTSSVANGFSIGVNTFSIDGANDRVGIGTITPQSKLHINGDAALDNESNKLVRDNYLVDMMPVAYGYVNPDGSLANSGTTNVTVVRTSAGVYSITYAGARSFTNTSDVVFSMSVTDPSGTAPAVANYRVTGANTIEVTIREVFTTVVLASVANYLDRGFSFELRIK